jgi:hypothetical protein
MAAVALVGAARPPMVPHCRTGACGAWSVFPLGQEQGNGEVEFLGRNLHDSIEIALREKTSAPRCSRRIIFT